MSGHTEENELRGRGPAPSRRVAPPADWLPSSFCVFGARVPGLGGTGGSRPAPIVREPPPVAREKRRRRSVSRSSGRADRDTSHDQDRPGERLERPSTAYPPISPPAQGSSYTVIFVLVDNHSSRDTDIFPSLLGAVTGTEHSCDSRRRHSTGLGHFQSRGIQVPISR